MTTINPSAALGAYKAASQMGSGVNGPGVDLMAAKSEGANFGDVLKAATQSTITAQKTSEAVSAQAVMGKADLTDVVNAVNNAEVSLNMFLAVRDKMVEAYNAISRTQI